MVMYRVKGSTLERLTDARKDFREKMISELKFKEIKHFTPGRPGSTETFSDDETVYTNAQRYKRVVW